jgi:adenine-specific DNA-methyltransferase
MAEKTTKEGEPKMTLLEELKLLLEKDSRLVSEGKLLKNRIVELALKLDKDLIKLLLSNERIKHHFFTEVDKILVFDKEKMMNFVDNKEFLPDSYTAFKNKIGLTADKNYIVQGKEVVLSWPYKDCILEGGQEKTDEKRKEIFHNEILAPDEIDRLLEPKVFTNFKRIDAKGDHEVKEIKPTDNLIIKGNNLLVLHSLKKRFAGKIKLIYIDPPYNTGNDEFKYNDSFNHSTWLSFMKNRLEVARELLKEDGSIWVNIDDNELAYLQVLLDEIFGSENYASLTTIKRSASTGHKAINPGPINVSDYILGYAKNKRKWRYNIQFTTRSYDEAYSLFIDNYEGDPRQWRFIPVSRAMSRYNCDIEELIKKYPERVVRFAEPSYSGVGKETRKLIDLSKKNPERIFIQERSGYPDIYLKSGQRILFYKDKLREIDGKLATAEPLTNIWTDIPFQGIAKEGGVVLLKGKKPEKLLKRIIEMNTKKGEIVLDYHLGSGTTCAVAHKTGRQYIGVEQLHYGDNSAVVRLKNVIDGNQTGISKAVNWKGGGDFVYCEVMKLNERFIQEIRGAEDTKELLKIWEEMKEHAFLSYKIEPKDIDENIEEFKGLSFENQKRFLIGILDKNDLYVNYSEIEDKQNGVSKEDIELNKKFCRGL